MFVQERRKQELDVCLRIEAALLGTSKTKLAQVQKVHHISVQVDNCVLAGCISGQALFA